MHGRRREEKRGEKRKTFVQRENSEEKFDYVYYTHSFVVSLIFAQRLYGEQLLYDTMDAHMLYEMEQR